MIVTLGERCLGVKSLMSPYLAVNSSSVIEEFFSTSPQPSFIAIWLLGSKEVLSKKDSNQEEPLLCSQLVLLYLKAIVLKNQHYKQAIHYR